MFLAIKYIYQKTISASCQGSVSNFNLVNTHNKKHWSSRPQKMS